MGLKREGCVLKLKELINVMNGNPYVVYGKCIHCGETQDLAGKPGSEDEMEEDEILEKFGDDNVVEIKATFDYVKIIVNHLF